MYSSDNKTKSKDSLIATINFADEGRKLSRVHAKIEWNMETGQLELTDLGNVLNRLAISHLGQYLLNLAAATLLAGQNRPHICVVGADL